MGEDRDRRRVHIDASVIRSEDEQVLSETFAALKPGPVFSNLASSSPRAYRENLHLPRVGTHPYDRPRRAR